MAMFRCLNSNLGNDLGLRGKKVRFYRSRIYYRSGTSTTCCDYAVYLDGTLIRSGNVNWGFNQTGAFVSYSEGDYNNGFILEAGMTNYTYDGTYYTSPYININSRRLWTGSRVDVNTAVDYTYTLP